LNSDLSRFQRLLFALIATFAVLLGSAANAGDALPSWNDGPTKKAILEFVAAVTDESGKDYVEPAERIAVFDNDGTLWVEQPIYTQLTFAFDRVKELAPQHPEWKSEQPFKAVLEGDMKTIGASGMKGLMEIVMATHSGMTAAEFEKTASSWLATEKHPKFDRLYTECVYQPQLELLAYLRANGFKNFIVSGGGIQFMRPWTEAVYGIPQIGFVNDKAGKPVGIHEHIGRRPILAFGNADADMQMIEYTMAGEGRRLALFVHHTDADREYAYDRHGHIGTLDKALDQAAANGWIIVDMKKEWKSVFPDG